jgi:hypothetical protein
MKSIFPRFKTIICPLGVSIMALGLSLTTGCAQSPIELSDHQTIQQTKGVVFGRLKAIFDGKVQETFSTMFGGSTMSLLILPDDSSKGTYISLREDGHFFLHLTPGGYTIAGFEGRMPGLSSYDIKGSIFAHFDVQPNTVTYIGTLILVFEGDTYKRYVTDEYELAIQKLQERFPEIKKDPHKNLMIMEKRR